MNETMSPLASVSASDPITPEMLKNAIALQVPEASLIKSSQEKLTTLAALLSILSMKQQVKSVFKWAMLGGVVFFGWQAYQNREKLLKMIRGSEELEKELKA